MDTRSAFEWGVVCHALAGEMREILEDWHLLITQLEHQQLLGRLDLSVSPLQTTLTSNIPFISWAIELLYSNVLDSPNPTCVVFCLATRMRLYQKAGS